MLHDPKYKKDTQGVYLLFKPRNFLKSFSEQTPHDRLASIPMISCKRITDGVPRAPKAAACWDVLREIINYKKTESDITNAFIR